MTNEWSDQVSVRALNAWAVGAGEEKHQDQGDLQVGWTEIATDKVDRVDGDQLVDQLQITLSFSLTDTQTHPSRQNDRRRHNTAFDLRFG
jgi:hypothetical protein